MLCWDPSLKKNGLNVSFEIEITLNEIRWCPQKSTLLKRSRSVFWEHGACFINDLPDAVESKCLMFADDVKLYCKIGRHEDCEFLQRQLNVLCNWSRMWGMSLNPSKCKVLTLSLRRAPLVGTYRLGGETLERVSEMRDLGVIVDKKLTSVSQVDHIRCVTQSNWRSHEIFSNRQTRQIFLSLWLQSPCKNILCQRAFYFGIWLCGLRRCGWNPFKAFRTSPAQIPDVVMSSLSYYWSHTALWGTLATISFSIFSWSAQAARFAVYSQCAPSGDRLVIFVVSLTSSRAISDSA